MTAARAGPERTWQMEMLRLGLKKRQKLRLLLEMLGTPGADRCLLVTAGDNTGALNHVFREAGGRWEWAELDAESIPGMATFLGEPVRRARHDSLPFESATFDRIVVIDVHEHLPDVRPFNAELARVLAPRGIALVTTPNGDRRLPVARFKRRIGMDERAYGHVVQGFDFAELESMMRECGLTPETRGAYSRFFTEMIELAINFAYVKVLSRGRQRPDGAIAPRTEAQLGSVGIAFRAWRALHPLLRAVSALDRLIPGTDGYAVAVRARKEP
jgi:SAM-dependent methyltransferase